MHYHIVGIGGAGMSAIAQILLEQGHRVSGSELQPNALTDALAAQGATIHRGHAAAYIAGATAVVTTAAAPSDHVEIVAAEAAGLPVLKRSDLWAEWTRQRSVIAVAGSHGKTTTTALIAWLLTRAGLNPGFLVGSAVPDLGSNACWGNSAAPLVIEADEYDRAFLALEAHIAVVTNVEWDHPDLFPTRADYERAFADFAGNSEGPIITCGDGGVGEWAEEARRRDLPVVTYGLETNNDYQAIISPNTPGAFQVRRSNRWSLNVHSSNIASDDPHLYQIQLPGRHNIQNALAAIVVADAYTISPDVAAVALHEFRGTARRFEYQGEIGGIKVVDDYAHHPTEVRVTLAAARLHYSTRRIVAYVQPHTFSRTETLLEQWTAAFEDADVVLVGAIYPAREQRAPDEPEKLARRLVEQIAHYHSDVYYAGDVTEAATLARRLLQSGDLLITMGAGNSNQVGALVLQMLEAAQS